MKSVTLGLLLLLTMPASSFAAPAGRSDLVRRPSLLTRFAGGGRALNGWRRLAKDYAAAGQWGDAADVYTFLTVMAPSDASAWKGRAHADLALGRFAAAAADLDRLEALGVHEEDAAAMRATSDLHLGDVRNALRSAIA